MFDYKVGERFGCVADIGWITGHSYVVYGPLLNGATTVLFESNPIYPDAGKLTKNIQGSYMHVSNKGLLQRFLNILKADIGR